MLDIIVINDGQVRYPMLRSAITATAQELREMDGDTYSAWCSATPMLAGCQLPGTAECIDLCDALIEAGVADTWSIA